MFKQEKGITLVALVITIIVLLILAGVSISLVLGENGVLSQAKNATTATTDAQAREGFEAGLVGLEGDFMANEFAKGKDTQFSDYVYDEGKENKTNPKLNDYIDGYTVKNATKPARYAADDIEDNDGNKSIKAGATAITADGATEPLYQVFTLEKDSSSSWTITVQYASSNMSASVIIQK